MNEQNPWVCCRFHSFPSIPVCFSPCELMMHYKKQTNVRWHTCDCVSKFSFCGVGLMHACISAYWWKSAQQNYSWCRQMDNLLMKALCDIWLMPKHILLIQRGRQARRDSKLWQAAPDTLWIAKSHMENSDSSGETSLNIGWTSETKPDNLKLENPGRTADVVNVWSFFPPPSPNPWLWAWD